ncbi:MAG: PilZ domain-containing protein [Desulfomonilaceae bacterium]
MSRRIIQARDIVIDIRSGMTDAELMEKYELSAKGLESAFTKLVNSGIMTVAEVYGQRGSGQDTVIINDVRELPRHFLSMTIPVHEPGFPNRQGRIRDVTEKGIGITGIQARIGEVISLMIACRPFLDVDNIWLEAECRWIDARKSPREWYGGFQITKISPKDLSNLRQLIQLLSLG